VRGQTVRDPLVVFDHEHTHAAIVPLRIT
jgi:hypothetical protein